MPPTPDQLLKAGIRAVKAGEREAAKQHFLQIIEQDERHELAWLWLSTAVSTKEEQILCLENVLTINPSNEKAQARLEKLRGVLTIIDDSPGPDAKFQAETNYNDVWTQDVDLCPYCANVLNAQEKKCARCQKPLLMKTYRYPKATPRVTMFWVVLFGLSNINLVQAIYDYIFWGDLLGVFLNLFLVIVFFVLAIGAGFRRFWAFFWSQIVLGILLLYTAFDYFFPLSVRSNTLPEMNPVFERFVSGLGSGFDFFLFTFETAGLIISLILAVVFLAPDFDQVTTRLVAKLGKKKPNGADYDFEARRFAEAGMWATAVLHWQRAAALAPAKLSYQTRLADGYARLGFFERSLDVLQSAQSAVFDAKTKAQLQQKIDRIGAQAQSEIKSEK